MDPSTSSAGCGRRRFPRPRGMDPGHRPPTPLASWFPRPRGDGPAKDAGQKAAKEVPRPRGDGPPTPPSGPPPNSVSPPTRGWTVSKLPDGRRQRGFPAPRGDGPRWMVCSSSTPSVSPPTRGWTFSSGLISAILGGFPAHAGMDRHTRSLSRSACGFPRPRGDGPATQAARRVGYAVSPPTRGWTRYSGCSPRRVRGFPAHAGMDQAQPATAPLLVRFPRPRGDGPEHSGGAVGHLRVSPPTRGWTALLLSRPDVIGGFPAHAGMDQQQRHRAPSDQRFPRPRGDGPAWRMSGSARTRVSPPTRGWTARDDERDQAGDGFPAHAGMDRITAYRPILPSGFPRPRGDGPQRIIALQALEQVSPPTRGWTPAARPDPGKFEVSPPTRGWTPGASGSGNRHRGFPAHAGMDP